MGTMFPVFPVPETSHFGDYDPQIDKVVKEVRKQLKEATFSAGGTRNATTGSSNGSRQEETDGGAPAKKGNTGKKWWNRASALIFWKKKRFGRHESLPLSFETKRTMSFGTPYPSSSSAPRYGSFPVYGSVEDFLLSRKSLPATPMRKRAGRTPGKDDVFDVPYLKLKELNMGVDNNRFSTVSSPIYLVTSLSSFSNTG